MSQAYFRTSLSLPSDQAQLLASCAKRLSCSQSSVVSILLDEFLPRLALGLGNDAAEAAAADTITRRFVGESASAIRDDVRQALREGSRMLQSDMFAAP